MALSRARATDANLLLANTNTTVESHRGGEWHNNNVWKGAGATNTKKRHAALLRRMSSAAIWFVAPFSLLLVAPLRPIASFFIVIIIVVVIISVGAVEARCATASAKEKRVEKTDSKRLWRLC